MRAIRNGLSLHWNREAITNLLVTLVPLGLVSFLISMQSSLPRLLLNRHGGESELGVFVALTAILIAGMGLAGSVSQAIVPRLAWLRADDDRHGFVRLLLLLLTGSLGLTIAAVLGAWIVGPFVVRILYSAEYAEHNTALMWLAVACGVTLMGGFVGNAITVARQLRIQVVNNVIALGVLFALCLVLVPRYGIAGAAASIALSDIIVLLLNVVVLIRFLDSWSAKQDSLRSAGA